MAAVGGALTWSAQDVSDRRRCTAAVNAVGGALTRSAQSVSDGRRWQSADAVGAARK